MSKIHELLRGAYDLAYDLPRQKAYTEPKIQDYGGDLSQRWYAYFSFRNPDTGKLERQTPIYTGLHEHKNLSDRKKAAGVLRNSLSSILKHGLYNPFEEKINGVEQLQKLTVKEAVAFVLKYKENIYKGGYTDFKSRIKQFEKWLIENGFVNRYVKEVNKVAVKNYLNYLVEKNSAANSNNSRSAIHNFFECLLENDYIEINPVARIKPIKNVKPQRNRSFTSDQVDDIFKALEDDPMLTLYLKFVSYNFLRPIEVSRLEPGNINIEDKTLAVATKDGKFKIKKIPDILLRELPDISNMKKTSVLFGESGFGQEWKTEAENRRGLYGKRFNRKIKKILGFGPEYGMYSFRHTFVARLFTALMELHSLDEAESRTMHITGHATRKALRKYLREIDAHLPDDYSKYLDKVE